MRTFARDRDTNDITFGFYASRTSGNVIKDVNVIDGKDGVLAVVESVVKTEVGELQLDTNAGINHIGLLANGSSLLPFWRKDMEDAVLGCAYVSGIKTFDVRMDSASESVVYTLEIETPYGDAATEDGVGSLAKVRDYGNARVR